MIAFHLPDLQPKGHYYYKKGSAMNLYHTVSSQKVGGRDLKLAAKSQILLLKTTLKEVREGGQT